MREGTVMEACSGVIIEPELNFANPSVVANQRPVGLLVCCPVGFCCFIGLYLCWFTGPLSRCVLVAYWSVVLVAYWSVVLLVYWSVVLFCSVGLLVLCPSTCRYLSCCVLVAYWSVVLLCSLGLLVRFIAVFCWFVGLFYCCVLLVYWSVVPLCSVGFLDRCSIVFSWFTWRTK